MAQLIKPGTGLLVCLEYPLFRPAETGGPPHGINSSDYDMLLRDDFVKEMHYVSYLLVFLYRFNILIII
jgi:hypothetical protein